MKTCIVLSAYNGSKYIVDQLKTINNQSRKVDAVYIFDDNSIDDTYEVIKNYIISNNLHNWFLKKNTKNLGWKLSFANAIMTIPNEYDVIFLSDQDDIWYKNKIDEMLKIYESNCNIGLLVSNYDVKYFNKNAKKIVIKKLGNKRIGKVKIKPEFINIRRPGCTFAVERKMAQEAINTIYIDSFAHDKFLWMYAFCKNRLYYYNVSLILFRRFDDSATYMNKKSNRLEIKINESKDMINYCSQCLIIDNLDSKVKKILLKMIDFEKKRQSFFETKNIFTWLSLLPRIKYYTNYRMWIGDLLFAFLHIK